MTTRFLTLLLLLIAVSALAQPDISGYYEHTFQLDYTDQTDENILDASKLRVDLQSGGADGELEFRGNVNIVYYHSDISFDASPYLPAEIVAALNRFGATPDIDIERQRIYLDNAFLSWQMHKNLRLRVGKQQLAWGTGYSFNPTDLFHAKTLIDPTYEKEGVTAFRMDYRWGIGGQLAGIMAPDNDFASSGYAIRAASYFDAIGYDVAVTAHSVTDTTSLDPRTFLPRSQRRQAVGLEFAGSPFGLGFWMEGNYNWMEVEDDFIRVVTGLDYTLENGLYLMAEAFYNQRAEEDAPYPIHDWLANLAYGEPIGPGWIMVGTRYDLTTLIVGSLYGFAAPDGSYLINPRLDISIAQNADLVIFGAVTLGEDGGTFSSGLYSGFLRGTVYF
ncbi:hypothetical protein BMS3Bbin04_01864 [bacterium BMS3Bbin04]|nr:hypothetical protein BMS3Bbin04_01864 [bacterium BMS3Bbin04]